MRAISIVLAVIGGCALTAAIALEPAGGRGADIPARPSLHPPG
jgi:hypothetical protein